jgi:hypothetical protein
MALDLLAVALLGGFAGLGAIRGTFRSAVRLLCWLLGYAGAVVGAPWVAPYLVRFGGLSSALALVVGGSAILIGVWAIGGLGIRVLGRFGESERHLSGRDGVGGAAFGLAQGALLALLVGWLGLWLQAAQRIGAEVPVSPPPDSFVAQLAGSIAGTGVEVFLDSSDPSVRMAARLATDPADSIQRIQSLTEHPQIVALRTDPTFWRNVRSGALESALNRRSFARVAQDATLRQELADLGVVDPSGAAGPQAFRDQVKITLTDLGERVRGLEEGPELQSIAEDAELQDALARGDTVALLRDSRVQELLGTLIAPSVRKQASASTRL